MVIVDTRTIENIKFLYSLSGDNPNDEESYINVEDVVYKISSKNVVKLSDIEKDKITGTIVAEALIGRKVYEGIIYLVHLNEILQYNIVGMKMYDASEDCYQFYKKQIGNIFIYKHRFVGHKCMLCKVEETASINDKNIHLLLYMEDLDMHGIKFQIEYTIGA